MEKQFVHVVNFWLKSDSSTADREKFEIGVKSLGTIESVSSFHLGVPAPTDRPVIDRSYDYCLVCTFKNQADQDAYQVDPIHDIFRNTCSIYWDKVLIFDSISIL